MPDVFRFSRWNSFLQERRLPGALDGDAACARAGSSPARLSISASAGPLRLPGSGARGSRSASSSAEAALPGDAAALDDGVPVGELHQALDVLVDHQDGLAGGAQRARGTSRSPRAPAARGPRWPRPGSAGAGLVTSARPMASICCSPPESWLPMFSLRSACSAERTRTPSPPSRARLRAGAVAGEGDAGSRARVRLGKICRPSGTSAMPRRAMRSGDCALDALAAKADRCRSRARVRPMIERTVVVLPMPLRPSSVTRFALGNLQSKGRTAPGSRRRRSRGSRPQAASFVSQVGAAHFLVRLDLARARRWR